MIKKQSCILRGTMHIPIWNGYKKSTDWNLTAYESRSQCGVIPWSFFVVVCAVKVSFFSDFDIENFEGWQQLAGLKLAYGDMPVSNHGISFNINLWLMRQGWKSVYFSLKNLYSSLNCINHP